MLSDSTDELSYKAHFVPDKCWNQLWEEIDNAIENSGPSPKEKEAACMALRYSNYFRSMYQCYKCGRFIVFDQNHELISFVPDSDEPPVGLLDE
jgi:hypothetical protein